MRSSGGRDTAFRVCFTAFRRSDCSTAPLTCGTAGGTQAAGLLNVVVPELREAESLEHCESTETCECGDTSFGALQEYCQLCPGPGPADAPYCASTESECAALPYQGCPPGLDVATNKTGNGTVGTAATGLLSADGTHFVHCDRQRWTAALKDAICGAADGGSADGAVGEITEETAEFDADGRCLGGGEELCPAQEVSDTASVLTADNGACVLRADEPTDGAHLRRKAFIDATPTTARDAAEWDATTGKWAADAAHWDIMEVLGYAEAVSCMWTISCPPNETISFQFLNVSIGEEDDLFVYDSYTDSGPIAYFQEFAGHRADRRTQYAATSVSGGPSSRSFSTTGSYGTVSFRSGELAEERQRYLLKYPNASSSRFVSRFSGFKYKFTCDAPAGMSTSLYILGLWFLLRLWMVALAYSKIFYGSRMGNLWRLDPIELWRLRRGKIAEPTTAAAELLAADPLAASERPSATLRRRFQKMGRTAAVLSAGVKKKTTVPAGGRPSSSAPVLAVGSGVCKGCIYKCKKVVHDRRHPPPKKRKARVRMVTGAEQHEDSPETEGILAGMMEENPAVRIGLVDLVVSHDEESSSDDEPQDDDIDLMCNQAEYVTHMLKSVEERRTAIDALLLTDYTNQNDSAETEWVDVSFFAPDLTFVIDVVSLIAVWYEGFGDMYFVVLQFERPEGGGNVTGGLSLTITIISTLIFLLPPGQTMYSVVSNYIARLPHYTRRCCGTNRCGKRDEAAYKQCADWVQANARLDAFRTLDAPLSCRNDFLLWVESVQGMNRPYWISVSPEEIFDCQAGFDWRNFLGAANRCDVRGNLVPTHDDDHANAHDGNHQHHKKHPGPCWLLGQPPDTLWDADNQQLVYGRVSGTMMTLLTIFQMRPVVEGMIAWRNIRMLKRRAGEKTWGGQAVVGALLGALVGACLGFSGLSMAVVCMLLALVGAAAGAVIAEATGSHELKVRARDFKAARKVFEGCMLREGILEALPQAVLEFQNLWVDTWGVLDLHAVPGGIPYLGWISEYQLTYGIMMFTLATSTLDLMYYHCQGLLTFP